MNESDKDDPEGRATFDLIMAVKTAFEVLGIIKAKKLPEDLENYYSVEHTKRINDCK